MEKPTRRQKVVIVGAGPVGSLAALYAASRGDDVEVYELRGDLRDSGTIPLNFTKSINLALSERGINSMIQSNRKDLVDALLGEAIPMYGRMIHGKRHGKLVEDAQPYDVHGRVGSLSIFEDIGKSADKAPKAINSIDRATLNNALLDELEKTPNVKLFFNHKMTGADFRTHQAWFERRMPGDIPKSNAPSDRAPEIEVSFDYLIGADGAHSAARFHMMKFARVDYQQEYIDTLWCEFQITASETGDFRISPNHLHIWPGREFMFIALPSADKTFTCTLFAPSTQYSILEKSPQRIVEFFEEHFPGVCPELINPDALVQQFIAGPHLPLIGIKCNPHHFNASVVILGDAAHAVLPFYGQGLNAGLEDVRVLFELFDQHGVYAPGASFDARCTARAAAFNAYTELRSADGYAINDLSKQNYLEMRWGVKSPLYRFRKLIEESLDRYLPSLGWKTQYARVSFSNERYSEVVRAVRQQGLLLGLGLGSLLVSTVGIAGVIMWKYPRQLSPLELVQHSVQRTVRAWFRFAKKLAYA